MSQERVLKTLLGFGLTEMDAKVYIFLAKKGLQKAIDIAKSLKMNKEQLYRSLKKLQSKGIVTATLEHPARFSALPFEKVLDLFVKAKMEEAQEIKQNKDEILSFFQSIAVKETDASARFTVIEGRKVIYSKIQQMIQETKSKLSAISTVPSLMRADQFGLFDLEQPLKSKIQFRFLTEVSEQNIDAMKNLLKEMTNAKISFEGRTPDLGLKLFPRMVIRDEEEAIFFVSSNQEPSLTEQDDVCLWTNSKALVQAFDGVFEDLWRNSTDVRKKIREIETGTPLPKTCVISDAEAARKKYFETTNSAKREILMMTSSKGLSDTWESIQYLKHLFKKGVSVKIMAPITGENLKIAQQLSEFCEVRYVPTSYLRTSIVDGQHLFQFKNPQTGEEEPETELSFEDTFYTNDNEYVNKTEKMLDEIWQNARSPSAMTLDLITKASEAPNENEENVEPWLKPQHKVGVFTIIKDEDSVGKLTEKDVLNKVVSGPKHHATLEGDRAYLCMGEGIIRQHRHYNLPDTMIHIQHFEKQSSFGEEDAITVYLWLETPKGQTFVPVAVIQDHPGTTDLWKRTLAGTPAAQNIHLVKKEEINVRLRGNTLFAGWTIPIPLFPSQYVLQPGSLLLEGYGKLKTGANTVVIPSGFKLKTEYNGFEAFITFVQPSSKYSGPATDGFLARDAVMDISPPQ
jgi:sugar-specific transcriptional regulator TrmB